MLTRLVSRTELTRELIRGIRGVLRVVRRNLVGEGKIEDWGVIGVAEASGKACVISSYRCKMGAKDQLQARIRLAKVAVHELGHTLGLDHCSAVGCLMQDARGRVSTCDGEFDLCARCRSQLKAQGHTLPDNPGIPWSRIDT